MNYHVNNLNSKSRYEFWVTAHTGIGEGSPSTKATLTPSSRVPAKIASFDETFVIPAKRTVKLPCIAVGSPSPDLSWKVNEREMVKSDRVRLLPDGSLQITNVSKDDAGTYKCLVNNKFGQVILTSHWSLLIILSSHWKGHGHPSADCQWPPRAAHGDPHLPDHRQHHLQAEAQ